MMYLIPKSIYNNTTKSGGNGLDMAVELKNRRSVEMSNECKLDQ